LKWSSVAPLAARVQGVELVLLGDVDDGEEIAREAGIHRLNYIEHGRGRHRSVDGIAALHQDLEAGLRGERLARGDHAVLGHHLGAPLGGPTIGPIAPHGVAGWGLRVGVADRQQRHSLGHGGGRTQGEGERCGT
jgi:hypothetical protein